MLGFKLNSFRVGSHPQARLANDQTDLATLAQGQLLGVCSAVAGALTGTNRLPLLWVEQTLVLLVRLRLLVS
jgi:hypothetical protein